MITARTTRAYGVVVLALAALACATTSASHAQPAPKTQVAAPAASKPAAPASAAPSAAAPVLVPVSSAEGQARLMRSAHKVDFFHLANQFEAQEHGGNCGPTSAVIVLNTLRESAPPASKPIDAALFPSEYRANLPPGMEPVPARYTQGAFFDARFERVKPKARFFGAKAADGSRDPGMQLRQLHGVLREHGLDVTLRVVDDALDAAVVRRELLENLARENDYVIVNYTRGALGQPGGGHISPLAAYDAASDSVLVLDVNPSRAPWVWVPMDAMIAAMRTKDTAENRGYLLVREGR